MLSDYAHDNENASDEETTKVTNHNIPTIWVA